MKLRNSKGQFIKGCRSIRKGIKLTPTQKEKIRQARLKYLYKIGYSPKQPWDKTLRSIKGRISRDSKYKSGIYQNMKCILTSEQLKILWFKNKAYLMKRPSIDRKNSNKHYTFSNCQYIELSENCKKTKIDRKKHSEILKKVWQRPAYRKKMLKHLKRLNKQRRAL